MRSAVIQLFKKYGFDYKKSASTDSFMAFTFKSGFFHNAELVSLEVGDRERIENEMEPAIRDLESLGYSTKKSFYNSYKELEDSLFQGFFDVDDWKNKSKKEYDEHCQRILSLLPNGAGKYEYVNVPYQKNGVVMEEGNVVADICDSLIGDQPKLTIVEAPAGFGKTCTSYEVVHKLINSSSKPLPFFTEFSRDRQARVFSHIFIREVDRSFSSVNSDVVIEEVKNGRIVVVLDGFDEILHDKSKKEIDDKSYEDAEPMLETIGELLEGKAKIVLTSRRSAIFDGELFAEWTERYKDKFEVERFRLDKPSIKDWIQPERLEALNDTAIDLVNLANPVLLSYLRFISAEEYAKLCSNPHVIVSRYFESMLEREMDRQELRMNPEKQSQFLKLVASDMCDNNYTSSTKEELISTIKEKAMPLLNEVRTLYSAKDRPSLDKLATTLSNHAFFDRSNNEDNKVGFANEFVFGNYIALNALDSNTDSEWIVSDERFVEPAVMSYVPREHAERKLLWERFGLMKDFLDMSSRFKFECYLCDEVRDSIYSGCEISSLTINSKKVFTSGNLENSVFHDCTFKNVLLGFENMHDVTFLNCVFWDCEGALCDSVSFYHCKSNNDLLHFDEDIDSIQTPESNFSEVEEYVLSSIWPVGSPSIERLHHFIGVILKNSDYSKKETLRAIKSLKNKEILADANNVNFVAVNKDRVGDIKTILGRG